MFGIDEWQLFLIANIVSIPLFSIAYFFLKETSRIWGGSFSKKGIIVIGTITGLFICLLSIYTSMYIFYNSGTNISAGINYFIISPSLFMILIVCWMINYKLSIPLMMIQLFFFLFFFPWEQINTILENNVLFTLIIQLIFYLTVFIVFYFIKTKENFTKNNGYKIITPFIILLFLIMIKSIILYILLPGEQNNILWVLPIMITYYIIFFGLQISVVLLIEKLYLNFSKLETFAVKDDVSFYKMALAQKKLSYILDDNKISMGAVVLFDVKSQDKIIRDNCLRVIKEETENKYNLTFYFKATNNQYGAFFELSEEFDLKETIYNNNEKQRSEKDELNNIFIAVDKSSRINGIKIKATSSIYGVHSNSLNELIKHCLFLLTPIVSRANTNSLIVYDFSRVKNRLKERINVLNLPFLIDEMNISFVKGIGKENIYYSDINFNINGKNVPIGSFIKESEIKESEMILRYTSYQSLRKFKKENSSLIINYHLKTLSSIDFSTIKFIKKIEEQIGSKLIIIGFYSIDCKITKVLLKNLEDLRSAGFKFAFTKPSNFNQEINNLILPSYIIDGEITYNPFKTHNEEINFKTEAIFLSKNIKYKNMKIDTIKSKII